MTNLDDVFKMEAFQTLTPGEREAYKQLLLDLQGKTPAESLQIIMKSSTQLPQKKLTQAEQNAMIAALMASLPEADQAKFTNILKVMDMMKR